ncbi:MAG TPA: peptidylprolyl isomerase [Trueperaceae bacterium]|nr:peptidylprolyl isomerase [Trueperaceae bacterium]
MRVIALLLATALIVISGFWLARDRSSEARADIAAAQVAAQQGAPAGEEGDDPPAGEPAERASPALPDGYEQVEYLSESPRRVFQAAEDVLDAGRDYVALLRTTKGDILVDLYEDRTPVTVNNFVFLSLNRFYEGVPFHRVIDGFMVQGGDPTGTGTGGPGYQFEDEIVEGLTFDGRGILAMANAGPGTNGSQFFITFDATPWLDGAHTIFGRVLAGDEVLDAITRVDPQQPSAIAFPDDPLSSLAEQGVDLPGEQDRTVGEAIEEALGTAPVAGQSFTIAGLRGVLGAVGGRPAYGFFAQPDVIEEVVVGATPAAQ